MKPAAWRRRGAGPGARPHGAELRPRSRSGDPTGRRGPRAIPGGVRPLLPDLPRRLRRLRARAGEPGSSQGARDKGRLLSMGGHNMFGFFRDDLPLYQMILDPAGQRELDHAVAGAGLHHRRPQTPARRLHLLRTRRGAAHHQGSGVRLRPLGGPEPRPPTPMIRRLATVYVDKARESLRTTAATPSRSRCCEEFFKSVSANIRRARARARHRAEPGHLKTLVAFAERAYRRP